MICNNCGKELPDNTPSCPDCKAVFTVKSDTPPMAQQAQIQTKYCSTCGEKINIKAVICPHCGVPTELYREDQRKMEYTSQPIININNDNSNTNSFGSAYSYKSKGTAALLCFFFGGLGIHRFYVGKVGTGILWILTLGWFGLGTLIDFIVILCGGFRDKNGQFLK